MAPRRKNTAPHSSPTASQLEARATLQNTPSQSKEESSSSGNGEESGSQSNNGSGGSVESASSSQDDATTPPPAVEIEVQTGAQEEGCVVEADEDITTDDTMVQYVHLHEYDPTTSQQLIDFFHFMRIVNRSEDFFKNGIVNKSATLINFAAETETTKHRQKDIASTWGPLDSIIVRGTFVNISKSTINRMLHGPEYITPASVGLFEGKHHAVTSEVEIEVQSSHERIMHWIARQISSEGENAS
ncbi:hypothetical protein KY284_007940 [Solanum tuberosum]|nr:hypothetical protein KY284_007940 [Solanum tuberosum]